MGQLIVWRGRDCPSPSTIDTLREIVDAQGEIAPDRGTATRPNPFSIPTGFSSASIRLLPMLAAGAALACLVPGLLLLGTGTEPSTSELPTFQVADAAGAPVPAMDPLAGKVMDDAARSLILPASPRLPEASHAAAGPGGGGASVFEPRPAVPPTAPPAFATIAGTVAIQPTSFSAPSGAADPVPSGAAETVPLPPARPNADGLALRSNSDMSVEATFAGVWAPDENACSPRSNRKGLLPAVINSDGAWAGETSCAFRSGRRDAKGWSFVAVCANARSRWTSRVRIAVVGNRLTWTSPQGRQSYVRCNPGIIRAEGAPRGFGRA